jgi:hypothetical protein
MPEHDFEAFKWRIRITIITGTIIMNITDMGPAAPAARPGLRHRLK